MVKLLQVKEFNALMEMMSNYTYIMTLGNGSMADEPRKNGWVVFEMGTLYNFAKWYSNKAQATLELTARTGE